MSSFYRLRRSCAPWRCFEQTVVCLGLALFALGAQADLIDVISKSKPSIVAVGSFNITDSPRFGFRGTGFVVGDGSLVITNAHVLPDTQEDEFGAGLAIRVVSDPTRLELRPATVISIDKTHDLVLLKIDGKPLPALPLADSASVAEGLPIAFIGFPIGGALGFTVVTHRGIISAITPVALPMPSVAQLNEKTVKRIRAGVFNIYQLDAVAFPGNSGGPVLNVETAEVIGVLNMVFVKSTKEAALRDPSGISYAIPVKWVNELLTAR